MKFEEMTNEERLDWVIEHPEVTRIIVKLFNQILQPVADMFVSTMMSIFNAIKEDPILILGFIMNKEEKNDKNTL